MIRLPRKRYHTAYERITRAVRRGSLDEWIPIYGSRGNVFLAVYEQAYEHLWKFPGIKEEIQP